MLKRNVICKKSFVGKNPALEKSYIGKSPMLEKNHIAKILHRQKSYVGKIPIISLIMEILHYLLSLMKGISPS